MENDKVTTDELAEMIKNGFDEMGGEMAKRFDKVEGRLTKVEDRLSNVENSLNNIVHRFEFYELERRVESLELKLQAKN